MKKNYDIRLFGFVDIWCTGAVDIKGNELPFLKSVEGFDSKLEGFLSEQDNLFIVPLANITHKNKILLKQKNIRVIDLKQFQNENMKFENLFETKTVLTVNGN